MVLIVLKLFHNLKKEGLIIMNRKDEINAVEVLGELIGYGNLMEIASALWDEKLTTQYAISNAVHLPVVLSDIKLLKRNEIMKRHTQIYNESLRRKID